MYQQSFFSWCDIVAVVQTSSKKWALCCEDLGDVYWTTGCNTRFTSNMESRKISMWQKKSVLMALNSGCNRTFSLRVSQRENKTKLCFCHLWFIYSGEFVFGADLLSAPWPWLDKRWFQGCDFQVPTVFCDDACGDTNASHSAGFNMVPGVLVYSTFSLPKQLEQSSSCHFYEVRLSAVKQYAACGHRCLSYSVPTFEFMVPAASLLFTHF